MNPYVRRRLAAAGAVVALVVVVAGAFALTGGGESGPAPGAARLVPAQGLLAYVHVSTDAGRAGTRRATALARKFPAVEAAMKRLVGGLARGGHGLGVDYARDIAPWIGKDAALALLDVGNGVASSEIVVGVHDEAGARGFLGRLGKPVRTTVLDGVPVADYGGQEVAFVSGYLVTGPAGVVRSAVGLSRGHGAALADSPDYRRASAGAPSGHVLDAYATTGGVVQVLSAVAMLRPLGRLLANPHLRGAYLAVTAHAHSADVHVREALARGTRPAPSFTPTLAAAVPAGVAAFLDVTALDRRLPGLLALVGSTSPTAGLGGVLTRAGAALAGAGVDLRRDVAPLFAGETAVALTPNLPVPTLTVVARTTDEAGARTALAKLQGPLGRVLGTATAGAGTVPTFTQSAVAGVTAYRLRVNPALELDYAVARGRIAVSTSLAGIAAAMGGKGALADDPAYRSAAGGGPKRVTSVLFLDLKQLLRVGAQTGLDEDPQFLAVRNDLRRVHAVGLTASSGEAETTAELSLQIP